MSGRSARRGSRSPLGALGCLALAVALAAARDRRVAVEGGRRVGRRALSRHTRGCTALASGRSSFRSRPRAVRSAVEDDIDFREAVRALRPAGSTIPSCPTRSSPSAATRRKPGWRRSSRATPTTRGARVRRGCSASSGWRGSCTRPRTARRLLSATIANLTLAIALDPAKRRREVQPRARLPAGTRARGDARRRPARTRLRAEAARRAPAPGSPAAGTSSERSTSSRRPARSSPSVSLLPLVALLLVRRRAGRVRGVLGLARLPRARAAARAGSPARDGDVGRSRRRSACARAGRPRCGREPTPRRSSSWTSRARCWPGATPGRRRVSSGRQAAAIDLRAALPEVRFGVASLTDRTLPHLFPSTDRDVFEATLTRSLGIEQPPPRSRSPRPRRASTRSRRSGRTATSRRRLASGCWWCSPTARAQPVSGARLASLFRKPPVIDVVFVHLWHADERVFTDGAPEPQYEPDPSSRAVLDGLARSVSGAVYAESGARRRDATGARADRQRPDGRSGRAGSPDRPRGVPGGRRARAARAAALAAGPLGGLGPRPRPGTRARRRRESRSRPDTRSRGSQTTRAPPGSPRRGRVGPPRRRAAVLRRCRPLRAGAGKASSAARSTSFPGSSYHWTFVACSRSGPASTAQPRRVLGRDRDRGSRVDHRDGECACSPPPNEI